MPQTSTHTSRLILLCFLTLLLLLAKPLVLGHVYVNGDLGMTSLPMRGISTANRFWRAILTLWFPRVFGGVYLLGEGQTGMYHPVHLLLYRALPLQVAFNLEILLAYACMFPGMYLLLRRLDLPTPAALFGALAFTFSGSSMLRVIHINAVTVLAHVPWLLASIDILLRTTERRRLAAAQLSIALLTASEFLDGTSTVRLVFADGGDRIPDMAL